MGAKIRRYVLGGLMVVALFFAQGAQPQAAVVQLDGSGLATGITGLSVGTDTYNISFEIGTYDALFPGGELFPDASSFVQAIANELNAVVSPFILAGSFTDRYAVPESVNDPSSTNVRLGMCGTDSAFPLCGTAYSEIDPDIFINDVIQTSAWAVPTLTPVPLPAALPLFGSALAMLGMVGWRRKRRAAA